MLCNKFICFTTVPIVLSFSCAQTNFAVIDMCNEFARDVSLRARAIETGSAIMMSNKIESQRESRRVQTRASFNLNSQTLSITLGEFYRGAMLIYPNFLYFSGHSEAKSKQTFEFLRRVCHRLEKRKIHPGTYK